MDKSYTLIALLVAVLTGPACKKVVMGYYDGNTVTAFMELRPALYHE